MSRVAEVMNYLRAGVRIPVELPVQVRWKSPTGKYRVAEGRTACISGNGMFIAVPIRLRHETPITVTVTLPVEVTKIPIELRCQARVVRQPRAEGLTGVGAIIDDYAFHPLARPV